MSDGMITGNMILVDQILRQQEEIESLRAKVAELEEENKEQREVLILVEAALDDVDYSGHYDQGVLALKAKVAELENIHTVEPLEDKSPMFEEIEDILHSKINKLEHGLQNCRLLAARHRKEDWALLILGFCAEAGVVGSVTR